MDKQYIVINKDDNEENSFSSLQEARYYLTRLVMMGIAAYMITAPIYKV